MSSEQENGPQVTDGPTTMSPTFLETLSALILEPIDRDLDAVQIAAAEDFYRAALEVNVLPLSDDKRHELVIKSWQDAKEYNGTDSTLYREVLQLKLPHGSHASDLYLPATAATEQLLKRHPIVSKNATKFRNELDGALWYEVPFAFEPYWIARAESKRQLKPNG